MRISRRKFNRINAVADERGIIAAAAMDQRSTLRKAITEAKGSDATDTELSEFKALITEMLTPYASAILLDPIYGLQAMRHRAKNAGVLLAYEETGHDASEGRLPVLLSQWSVRQLVEAGADAVKLVLRYDPVDPPSQLNIVKHAFVERVGAECYASDVPFFLEVLAYSDEVSNAESIEFARVKPDKVTQYMKEFSKPQYRVDVLKVEVPVNMRYVEGSKANSDGQFAYSREEAKQRFREAAAASQIPFIYLSAGVSKDVFLEALELAAEAKVPFSGVLCGRATWQDGIKVYTQGGATALRNWLEVQGVPNIQALNQALNKGAKPWWNCYSGKEDIEIVDTDIAPISVWHGYWPEE
jgi:tagatose 1,6-diphosphate aldolase